jgi:hypothetical protein
MKASKPLNHKFAIALALAAMWLLAVSGVFVLIRSDAWYFIGLRGHDAITIEQIGAFFSAWTAAQIPAVCMAAMIIRSSDFVRPLRTTFWTLAAYELLFTLIRSAHWPWSRFHDLDQSIPVLAYLLSSLTLIGAGVFFAWLMPRWHKIFQRYFTH